jgi:hypothetical protein
MPKESLYCIPFNKKITRKDGFVYQCERDIEGTADMNKCPVCNKEFKDQRCVKIHKTKMNHWNLRGSPKAPTQAVEPQLNPRKIIRRKRPEVQSGNNTETTTTKRTRGSSGSDSSRAIKSTRLQNPI